MLRISNLSESPVYALSAGKGTLDFADENSKKKAKSRRHDPEYRNHIEILQDFEFPVSSQKVKISKDEKYIASTGIYPPEVRIFDTAEMCMKFSRGLDSEVIDFLFLSEDYKKLLFLQKNRFLEFHSQGGRHHCLRIPKEGRCLEYSPQTAELFVVGSTSDIYRIDLELGEFLIPLNSGLKDLNFCVKNKFLPLISSGGSDGILTNWDIRCGKKLNNLSVAQYYDDRSYGSLSLECASFSPDGMKIAIGMGCGIVRLFDLRSSKIVYEKNHRNSLPIRHIEWIDYTSCTRQFERYGINNTTSDSCQKFIASCDSKSIKIYSSIDGEIIQIIENIKVFEHDDPSRDRKTIGEKNEKNYLSNLTDADINNFTFYPNSGLCFVANEQRKLGIYFVPAVGIAPRWCTFLESITEDLYEKDTMMSVEDSRNGSHLNQINSVIYDDYHFITKSELDTLGMASLIGTDLLKAYMHGFFMDSRLYRKIKSSLSALSYEDYRMSKIREKLNSKRKMRLSVKDNVPKVNQELAEKLTKILKEGKNESKKKQKQAKQAESLLTDPRFTRIFKNPEFAIDSITI